jgi:hypothetical protein
MLYSHRGAYIVSTETSYWISRLGATPKGENPGEKLPTGGRIWNSTGSRVLKKTKTEEKPQEIL